jgi:hypothetical protein
MDQQIFVVLAKRARQMKMKWKTLLLLASANKSPPCSVLVVKLSTKKPMRERILLSKLPPCLSALPGSGATK